MEQTATTPEQKLFRALMQFHRLNWHQRTIAGCKPSEIRVLFCIKRGMNLQNPEMKVSEISRGLHVTSPTITQLLKGLEINDLIERHMDPLDRRAVGVTLTRKGEMVVQQAAEALSSSMQGLIAYLGEEESNQLTELLFKAFHYFNERETSMSYSQRNGDEEA